MTATTRRPVSISGPVALAAALWVVIGAGCGDNLPPSGVFTIVGHSDLGARGMNAALAVAGDTVYVGSRNDRSGIAIVDVADPTKPAVVGEIGPPYEALDGQSSRELRAVPSLNLLIVLNLDCNAAMHGCNPPSALETIDTYDITDRHAPIHRGTYAVIGARNAPHSPHEFFLWKDPNPAGRTLLYLSEPGGAPQFEVIDVSQTFPSSVASWDPIQQGGLSAAGTDNVLHSVSASDDGRVGFFSHQQGGLFAVDLSQVAGAINPPLIRMLTPPAQVVDWAPPGIGPHSAVPVPGRPLLVVTEEIYPMPFGAGCPWGHLRTVDVSDLENPRIVGEFQLPENDPATCANAAPRTAFTAHNPTAMHDLALVTWYAGGLQAIDISSPAHPFQLAELRPTPLPSVTYEDPALGGNPVEMWSYPVIQNGLIYVVDVRNGLYIVRYDGRWGEEITERQFLEGNSNLGSFLSRHP